MQYRLLLAGASLAAVASASPAVGKRQSGEAVTGGAAVTSINDNDGGSAVDSYTYYTGDGSSGDGWPATSQWASYESLFAANTPLMQEGCGNNGWGANDSDDEVAGINSAIEAVAAQTGVDHRFILAIMMQESVGCVRVPTTDNGVVNPGLMQDHDGSGTCTGVDPCPDSEISQMITDGTAGTSAGPGLAGLINQAQAALGDSSSRAFYGAARLYNSGSADYSNLDDGLGSTPCYVSDVANRLLGWTLAPSSCTA